MRQPSSGEGFTPTLQPSSWRLTYLAFSFLRWLAACGQPHESRCLSRTKAGGKLSTLEHRALGGKPGSIRNPNRLFGLNTFFGFLFCARVGSSYLKISSASEKLGSEDLPDSHRRKLRACSEEWHDAPPGKQALVPSDDESSCVGQGIQGRADSSFDSFDGFFGECG